MLSLRSLADATKKTTLFLRGMPVRVVREAKAAAARRGSTLAKLVADTLERSLADDDGTDTDPSDFDRSVDWFQKNRERLLAAYEDEYVAIAGARVIDHDGDFEALARRVFSQGETRVIYIPRVERRSRTLRLRSPRMVR
jgi:uncharacterized protein DUF5678